MKLYVPNNINIDDISCVYYDSTDNVYLGFSNGSALNLKYNNVLKDYITSPTPVLDVTCYDVELTHEVYYRNDLADILTVFFIITLVCFWFPYKIFSRAFGRWFKV